MSLERRIRSPSPSLFMPRPTAMTIFVFANKCRRAKKFELTKFDLLAYNPTLDFIARMIGMRTEGGIKSLHTVTGKKINGSRDLVNGGAYVGVSGHERFRKLEYIDGACIKFNRELRAMDEKAKIEARRKEKGLPSIVPAHRHPLRQQASLNHFYGGGHVLESSRDFRNNYRRITGNQIETPSTSGHNSLSPTISLPCISTQDDALHSIDLPRHGSSTKQRRLSDNSPNNRPDPPRESPTRTITFYHDSQTTCQGRHDPPTRCQERHGPQTRCQDRHDSPTRCQDRHDSPTRCQDRHDSPTRCQDRHKSPAVRGAQVTPPSLHSNNDKSSYRRVECKRGEQNLSPVRRVACDATLGRWRNKDTTYKEAQLRSNKDTTFVKEPRTCCDKLNHSPCRNPGYSLPVHNGKQSKVNSFYQGGELYREDGDMSPSGKFVPSPKFTETLPYHKTTVQPIPKVSFDVSPCRCKSPSQSFRNHDNSQRETKASLCQDTSSLAKHNHRNPSICSSYDCLTAIAGRCARNVKRHAKGSTRCCRDHGCSSEVLLRRGARQERGSPIGRRKRSRSAAADRYDVDADRRFKRNGNKTTTVYYDEMVPTRDDACCSSPVAVRRSRSPFAAPPHRGNKRQRHSIDATKESRPAPTPGRTRRNPSWHRLRSLSPCIHAQSLTIPFYDRTFPKRKESVSPRPDKLITPDPLQAKQALFHAKGVPYYSTIYSLEGGAKKVQMAAACDKQQFNTNPLPRSSKKKSQFYVQRSYYDERTENASLKADTLESQLQVLKLKREEYVPWSADTEVPLENSQTMIEVPFLDGDDYYSLIYKGNQGDLHVGIKEKRTI